MKIYISILIILLVLLLSPSCRITNLQDARPLGKGEKSIGLSLDSHINSDFLNENVSPQNAFIAAIPLYPSIDFAIGSRHNLDHNFSFSLAQGIAYATKISILSEGSSNTALALMPGAGIHYNLDEFNSYFRLPILISYYPGERLSFTVSAGLSRQTYQVNQKNITYFGNANMLFGRQFRYGLSTGLTVINGKPAAQVSAGFRFSFGTKQPQYQTIAPGAAMQQVDLLRP